MIDSLTIDEVVRQTGLTSRTLRYYEGRGLLRPLRTASGRRLFSASELERIQQIVALKKAGLNLGQIARVIDRKPIDIAALLEGQLAALDEQARTLATARTRLSTLLSRIKTGEQLDVATLCSLIKETDCMSEDAKWQAVIDRFYTPEEQADWLANVSPKIEGFMDADYNARWQDLGQRIEAALPLEPESDAALAFVREWFQLLEPFSSVATPDMWEQTHEFYQKLPEWENDISFPFSSSVWFFIREATDAARAAGKDIGPVPHWMQNNPQPKTEH
jgi:MerR family transcriptional regulator, thiopeptide resistance regulator